MEIERCTKIQNQGLNQKQRPENMAVNIALVDKSANQTWPILHVLKKDLWDSELATPKQASNGYMGKHPLIVLGPILSLDRYYKRIYLADSTLVTYNHLIVFNGSKFKLDSAEDLSLHAMQTLIHALRCQPIRPIQLTDSKKKRLPTGSVSQPPSKAFSKNIESALLHQLKATLATAKISDSERATFEHWLCEIQA